MNFINGMLMELHEGAWASRIHNNASLGKHASDKLSEMESGNSVAHVLLSVRNVVPTLTSKKR
jgi:hypothetical protein